MAQGQGQEVKVELDDPEYNLEEHIVFKRRQEVLGIQLKKILPDGLSEFRQIVDGSAYAFTKLNLGNKGVTAITQVITQYPHLRIVQLNSNQIVDISHLQKLKFVVKLDLSRNNIVDARFLSNPSVFPNIKQLNLAFNQLKTLPSLGLRVIQHLNLSGNHITTTEDFEGHPTIEILELRGNKLTSLKGIRNANSLRELYVADNSLSSFKELSKLNNLQRIHARKNKFAQLIDFPQLPSLKYLNLRENLISKIGQISNISLSVNTINLLANPISQELGDNTKKQIWMKLRQFIRINKSDITNEEKEEFDKQYKERIAELERQEKEAKEQAQKEALQKQS